MLSSKIIKPVKLDLADANLLKHFVTRHVGGAICFTYIYQSWEKTSTFFIAESQML